MGRCRFVFLCFLFAQFAEAQTPLERAVKRKDVAQVKKLLEEGADPNAVDEESTWSRTPLIAAAHYGAVEAAKVLLAQGANPNLYDGAGSTAMIRAIKEGHEDIVPLLLEYKADTELPTDDGSNRTPLIWAVLYKREKAVGAILAAGANPMVVFKNVFENKQKSCLDIARERSTSKIVAMLEKHLQ